jgi:hypothetical protein
MRGTEPAHRKPLQWGLMAAYLFAGTLSVHSLSPPACLSQAERPPLPGP